MAYVDRVYVSNVAPIPSAIIQQLESEQPGAFDAICEAISRTFDARLHKRYATPFKEPVPEIIRINVSMVVAYQVWLKVGFNPQSEQDALLKMARDDALEWLKEAANAETGLDELPSREDPASGDDSAAKRTRPLARTDASPYTWTRRQADRVRSERGR